MAEETWGCFVLYWRYIMQPDFQIFAAALSYLPENERVEIRRAFEFAVQAHAPQKREDGSPYVLHVIAVAEIAASWKADRDTIIASLLHDVIEDTPVKKEEITERFGRRAALLVESITKFTMSDLSADLPLDRKIETLRKLFDVMRYDMRSILIKLADRLHNVITIEALPTAERRRRFAFETLNIYHRIALHLGMRDVRHAYAEHCVPSAYDDGPQALIERNRFFEEAKPLATGIKHDLKHTNGTTQPLSIEVQPRNLLTFYLRRQAKGGEALLIDSFLVSIQVQAEDDCYNMLRLLHTLYRPVSGQFRDYIAAPSDAGYQSLHTVVVLPDGRAVEFRIRTPQMEEQAKRGITLWLFEGQKIPPNFGWLKRTEQLDIKTRDSSAAFWEALQADVLSETISVSIDRRRLSIPKGSTLLDAAYAAYDAKAGFLLSATVGGRTAPLASLLQEDDDIHLTFDQKMQADFDWLQMVATQHARMLIIEVLKKSDRSEKVSLGGALLQKELDHYGKGMVSDISKNQWQSVAEHFRRRTFDDVLSMIGEGVIRARDVVFFLFPDRRRRFLFSSNPSERYTFRLKITGTERPGQNILSLLHGIIRMADVTVGRTSVQSLPKNGDTAITVSGFASDRFKFADFVDMLERQEWTSRVQTLISRRQQLFLLGSFLLAFLIVLSDVVLFPTYQIAFERMSAPPQLLLEALPILPILGVNYYLLRMLRHYFVRMRGDRWFVGLGFGLNILGILLVIWKTPLLHASPSIPFVVLIFAFAMLFLAYKHAQAFIQLEPAVRSRSHPLSKAEKIQRKRRKIVGYALRFGAVFIWGIEPVLIRYTPMQQLSPLLRVNIWAVAGAVSGFVTIFLYNLCKKKKGRLSYTTPYNWLFVVIVVANLSYNYFLHKSLLFTTATNVNLMLSYAPIFALLLAFVIWRNRIPYLRSARSVQQMLVVFGLSAIGGSLLIYSDFHRTAAAATGDLFALLIAISDVAFIMTNIYYVKYAGLKTNTIALTTHHFLWIGIGTFFLMQMNNAVFPVQITYALTEYQWWATIAVGVLTLLGLVLTFEAFKRIDGLLAFLMLNLAPFVAFIAELAFFDSEPPTFIFLLAGLLIIGASVLAEIINARSERVV